MEATDELTKYAEEQFTLISNKFKDLTSQAIDTALGGNGRFAQLSTAWELEKSKDEMFLDEVNEQYGVDTLMRNIQKSIDETDSIYAQNKLMEKRVEIEKELAEIKEKQGKLTQYDLDRANALYELTLKQIALEEAQQAASKMKLVRDANGNYTYQYVQDQDAIAAAEQELADAQNNLYNLEKNRKKEMIDSYFSLMTEYQEKYAEAMATGNQNLMDSVYNYYFGNKGILTMLKTQLGFIEADAEVLSGLFDGESYNFSKAILEFDATGLQAIATETKTEIGSLKTTMEGLWGETSPLVSVIKELSDEIDTSSWSGLNNENLIDALTSEDGLISTITLYMGMVNSLQGKIDTFVTKYTDGALDSDTVRANTTAIQTLTDAIYAELDAKDGVIDNKYYDASIFDLKGNE